MRRAWVLATLSCIACSDPFEGRWEGVEDRDVDLFVEAFDDGYVGDGNIYLCNEDTCFLCPFSFDARESSDRLEVDGYFTGDCSSAGAFTGIECRAADDRLECELPGGVEIEYERAD